MRLRCKTIATVCLNRSKKKYVSSIRAIKLTNDKVYNVHSKNSLSNKKGIKCNFKDMRTNGARVSLQNHQETLFKKNN